MCEHGDEVNNRSVRMLMRMTRTSRLKWTGDAAYLFSMYNAATTGLCVHCST